MRLAAIETGYYSDRLQTVLRRIPKSYGVPRFANDDLTALFQRALSNKQRLKTSEEDRLLSQLAGDDRALYCLGLYLLSAERAKDADALLSRFGRTDAECLLRAAIEWERRNLSGTISALLQATERNARIQSTWAALGLAFAASGNRARAIYYLYHGLRIAPSYDEWYDDLLSLLANSDERRSLIVALRERPPTERSKWISPLHDLFKEPDDSRYDVADPPRSSDATVTSITADILELPPLSSFRRTVDAIVEHGGLLDGIELTHADILRARSPQERANYAATLYSRARVAGNAKEAIRWLGSYAFARSASLPREEANHSLLTFLYCSFYCNSDEAVRPVAFRNFLRNAGSSSGPDAVRQIQLFVRSPDSDGTIWAARIAASIPSLFDTRELRLSAKDRQKLARSIILDPSESIDGKLYALDQLLKLQRSPYQSDVLRSVLSIVIRIQGLADMRDRLLSAFDLRQIIAADPVLGPELSELILSIASQLERRANNEAPPEQLPITIAAQIDRSLQGTLSVAVSFHNTGSVELRSLAIRLSVEGDSDGTNTANTTTIDSISPLATEVRVFQLGSAIPGTEIVFDIDVRPASKSQERNYLQRFVEPVPQAEFEFGLIENPYLTGLPIPPGDEMFFGRMQEIIRLTNLLSASRGTHVPLVYGQRRTGKTSLLNRVSVDNAVSARYTYCLVDCERAAGQNTAAFVSVLLEAAYDALNVPEDKRLSEREIAISPLSCLRTGLKRMPSLLRRGKQRLLIALDEFEVLLTAIRDQTVSREVLSVLRSFIQHEQGLAFVIAGADELVERVKDYASPLYALARPIQVPYLAETEVRDLMTKPTLGSVAVDETAVAALMLLVNGHPHLSQLICHYVIEALNDAQRRRITSIDVDRAGELVINDNDAYFYELFFTRCSYDERLIIAAAAELGRQNRRISYDSLYQLIRTPSFALKPEMLTNLHDRQIFDFDPALRLIEFRLELFRRWVTRKHPFETLKTAYV